MDILHFHSGLCTAPPYLDLPRKAQSQPRSVKHIVALAARHGFAEQPVAECQMPGKPAIQVHRDTHIEVNTIGARIAKVVKHSKPLLELCDAGRLVSEIISPIAFSGVPGQWSIEFFMIVGRST